MTKNRSKEKGNSWFNSGCDHTVGEVKFYLFKVFFQSWEKQEKSNQILFLFKNISTQ